MKQETSAFTIGRRRTGRLSFKSQRRTNMENHRQALAAEAGRAAFAAAARYKAENPEANRLKIKATIAAYKPRNRELRKAPVKAVVMFLNEPATLKLSNADLAARLRVEVGERVPPNMLTERLTDQQTRQVQELLSLRKIDLDLATNDTASKIKLALRTRTTTAKADRKFVGSVSFTDGAVTIGDRSFPVRMENGLARVRVGKHKINLASLQALLLG
jgi:hypothetical protein